MADSTYDAVVIGAGHNGLILANYLVRAGLSVCVLERRLEAGGGLSTEEVTLPGFYHNLHSVFHDMVEIMPPYKDLNLEKYHVKYVCPPVQIGMPLKNGRALTIHTNPDETFRSIEKLSKPDAKTYRDVQESYTEFMQVIVLPALFTPPLPPSEQLEVLEKSPEGLSFLKLSKESPRDAVERLFETEEVRALVLFQLAIPRGVVYDYAGLGMLVPLVISQVEKSHLCVGGSHALAHALWRAFVEKGGVLRGVNKAKEILMDGNRAAGVLTGTGDKIMAKKLVASSVGLHQTFLELLPSSGFSQNFLQDVKNFKLDEFSIFSVHLALREPPRYRLPDMQNAFKVNIGFESVSDFSRIWNQIRDGKVPDDPCFYACCPTLFDPSQAPDGHHTAFLWFPVPYKLSEDGWENVKNDVMEKCIIKWKHYAPNLNKQNILAAKPLTPLDIEKKIVNMKNGGVFMGRLTQDQIDYFRPVFSLSQYRTPVENLYLCGACTHPGGGILGACGYNAAQVIFEDLKLPKWWEND